MKIFLILTLFLLVLLGCGDGTETETETETSPVVPTVDWELLLQDGDWERLAILPRHNLYPDTFRMVDEYIDPITSAYVAGKHFAFVIYKDTYIRQKQFFLVQPEPPRVPKFAPSGEPLLGEPTPLHVWHFPDPDAWWFQHWDRAGRDRTESGFTIEFDMTPMFEPSVPGVEKSRDYLHFPEFGTSLDGLDVGGPGAPEIKEGFALKIYVR